MNRTKKIALYGIMTSLSLVLGYLEHLLPLPIGIYGIKIGFANIIPLTMLYIFGPIPALAVNLIRIILSGLLFGSGVSLAYSLFGGLVSFAVMVLAKRSTKLSAVGVGILGGVAHNMGQLAVAVLLTDTLAIALYLPVLVISGAVAGTLVGLVSSTVIEKQIESRK